MVKIGNLPEIMLGEDWVLQKTILIFFFDRRIGRYTRVCVILVGFVLVIAIILINSNAYFSYFISNE